MFDKLIDILKANPRRIVFTEGPDARILEAASRLKKDGFLTPVLVGNVEEVKAAAAKVPRTLPRRKGWIYGEWLEACRGGEPASCNFDFAQYITEFVQLGNLAIRSGDTVQFDPVAMKVKDNSRADELLRIPYLNGWKLS